MMNELFSLRFSHTLFYPYSSESVSLLSGLSMQNRLGESIIIAAPKGWGLTGKDAGTAFMHPEIGIPITDKLDEALTKCNSLVVLPYEEYDDVDINSLIDETILNYIQCFEKKEKQIVDLRKLTGDILNDMNVSYEKREITTPVVFVDGIIEKVNKLDVINAINLELQSMGYKVCVIGTRPDSKLLYEHAFPSFMYDTISDMHKILLFYRYIMEISEKENPDIIILGVPGVTVPFNDQIYHDYGLTKYILSMAIPADYVAVCTNLGNWENDILNTIYKYRFGHEIDCICVSNTLAVYDPIESPDKLIIEKVEYTKIDEALIKNVSDIPMFNIFNDKNMKCLATMIAGKLSNEEYYEL